MSSRRGSPKADLAGPGIGNYEDLARALPDDYSSALSHRETMEALFAVKAYIEENLCRELGLMMVQVPLIVDETSGVNDYLDRDGSRTPVQFHISNDYDQHPIDAEVVQAATKWMQFSGSRPGVVPAGTAGSGSAAVPGSRRRSTCNATARGSRSRPSRILRYCLRTVTSIVARGYSGRNCSAIDSSNLA